MSLAYSHELPTQYFFHVFLLIFALLTIGTQILPVLHCLWSVPHHLGDQLYVSRFVKGVLRNRFGTLEFQIGSLVSEKIIIGFPESEKLVPYRSIPGT